MTAQKDRGNIKMQNTQRRIVLAALLQGEVFDREHIFSCGKVYELAARICELRKADWPILTVKHEDWKLARYMLIGARKEAAGNER